MGISVAPARTAEFREALASGTVLTADGALGTLLGERGISLRRCLDELSLSLPALIRDVHQDYLRAGAQIIETNTFGANRCRLTEFGLGNKVRAINEASVRIAREAARTLGEIGDSFVAGAVGPLGRAFYSIELTDARSAFREQIAALAEAGVDLLILETFRDLDELRQAVEAAREAAGAEIALVAQVSVEDGGRLACGISPPKLASLLNEWPVDVIGVNCASGPAETLNAIEAMAPSTEKPLSAMPNAGLPRVHRGQFRYPCSPEYLAEAARRLAAAGACIVGGCCGTTPEHIRRMREVLKGATPAQRHSRVSTGDPRHAQQPSQTPPSPIPLNERSRLGAKLAEGEFVTIVETQPPASADASAEIAEARRARAEGADFVLVRESRGSGRMPAFTLANLIQQQSGIECILPLSPSKTDVRFLESDLLGAQAMGIRNALASPDWPGLPRFAAEAPLVMGITLNLANPDLEEEARRLEKGIAGGVAFALTSPIFGIEPLEALIRTIPERQVPLIATIRTLAGPRDAEYVANELLIPIPSDCVDRMREAEGREAARAEGAQIARELRDRLRPLAAGVLFCGPLSFTELALDVAEGATLS